MVDDFVAAGRRGARDGYRVGMDWSLFQVINTGVATRDWLEDPVELGAALVLPLYAAATFGLWFLARPYGSRRWKLACASALASAALAMLANQAVSHVWERARPYVGHEAATHLLAAPSTDPSFPSDHAAAAFAIAFAVLAFSRLGGRLFLLSATLIGFSRIALGLHYPSDVLAGALTGWAAAMLVTTAGRGWIEPIVSAVSRISDPVLYRIWNRLPLPDRPKATR